MVSIIVVFLFVLAAFFLVSLSSLIFFFLSSEVPRREKARVTGALVIPIVITALFFWSSGFLSGTAPVWSFALFLSALVLVPVGVIRASIPALKYIDDKISLFMERRFFR